jgi:hypothetical protein|tara:strand:- start:108 stop:767 length:660 start_codon:yes stop_codon:yes gene_type:complete
MALTISENQGSFEELSEGKHNAVCYRIIDIGTHMELKFGSTTEYEKKHTVIFFWETLDEKMEDGRPFGVNKWYKLSLHEKSTLYRDLDTWKGGITNEELAGLDLTKLLGVNCVLNIVHSDKGRAKVKAVHRLDDSVVPTVNEAFTFDIDTYVSADNKEEMKKVSMMPEFFVDKIESSIEVEAWSQKNSTEDKSDLSSLKDLAEDGEIEDGGVTDKDIPF